MAEPQCLGDLRRVALATFVADFEGLREPVVITDLATGWPARERWTHAYLRELLRLDGESTAVRLTPELEKDLWFPPLARLRQHGNVWIGNDGYVTQLHYDLPHNLNTVLRGEKDFILFHPRETKNLYPYAVWHIDGPLNSRVVVDDVEPRFRRFRRARYWKTTIRPGETLYIPPFFWHHVRSRGDNVAANVWFHATTSRASRIAQWPAAAIGYAGFSIARRGLERAAGVLERLRRTER